MIRTRPAAPFGTWPRALLGLLAAACLLFLAAPAHAYPWMIRHGYTGCQPCHTDPSGGAGALTEYGRAQGDLLLRMRYGAPDDAAEASPTAAFAAGLIATPPPQVRLGADFREAFLSSQAEGAPVAQQFITMRADVFGDFKFGRFRAMGSLGYVPQGDLTASLTRAPEHNLISREHWLGVELDDDGAWLLRAGRLTLPFGIRMIEHTLWARTSTRTDLDATQQDGVSISFNKNDLRGEVMGILGNLQVRPDDFRERGYSAYVEYAPVNTLAFGASSLFTRATRDLTYGVTDYRYANGIFGRYSPVQPLVFLSEIDWVYQSLTWNGHRSGFAGFVQADYEPTQGMHLMLTGEAMNSGQSGEPASYNGWLSVVWFFLPHLDVRLDGIYSTLGTPSTASSPSGSVSATTWLAQLHVYL